MSELRHLGIYRPVTEQQRALDNKVLRFLFRAGFETEKILANKMVVSFEELQESLARLEQWNMIEIQPPHRGTTRRVALLPDGKFWGEELTVLKQQGHASA